MLNAILRPILATGEAIGGYLPPMPGYRDMRTTSPALYNLGYVAPYGLQYCALTPTATQSRYTGLHVLRCLPGREHRGLAAWVISGVGPARASSEFLVRPPSEVRDPLLDCLPVTLVRDFVTESED